MNELLQEIDQRCQMIAHIIGSCCVWKRTENCLTERRLKYSNIHRHIFCDEIKARYGTDRCIKNDTDLILRHLRNTSGQSFLHRCHGGAVELVIPVIRTGRVLGCLLCGPFADTPDHHPALPQWRLVLQKTLPELAEIMLGDLLERFYNCYPDTQKIDSRIEKALNFIAANYSRSLTLQETAQQVCLSPSRLSHLFKQQCGTDFSSYLRKLRLTIARDMLEQTSLPLGQIALMTGFSSQQHFTAAYKMFYRTTPLDSRKNNSKRSFPTGSDQ